MHIRRRDVLGRFLPLHSTHDIRSDQAPEVNPFAETFVQNRGVFDLSEGDLYFLNEPPKKNILPLVLYQGTMAPNPPRLLENPTFEFPISNQHDNANLKNILASSLPKFYGLVTKDPDTFLFEFDILYRSYDYTIDAHKLKLFPATLKKAALRWFMSLGRD